MKKPSKKPRPGLHDKPQENQVGRRTTDGEMLEENTEVSNANTPIPELPDKTQDNQLGGGEADGEKYAPSTEVTNAIPGKMILKDIKGMVKDKICTIY